MDMIAHCFGIEAEMNGVTCEQAAQISAKYFETSNRYHCINLYFVF